MATFRKLSVVKLSANFKEATKIVKAALKSPGDDEVLIKNLYSGVNATDVNITAGRYMTDGKVPFDIGLEGLGVVERLGKNIKAFNIGQPVLGLFKGGYSEYLYAKQHEMIPVPEANPEFIALVVCGLTAAASLDQSGRIKSGEKVLITAAAGGTGHIAVQWAKLKGCHVIGTCSTKEKEQLLKSLGCDRVINYKEESIDEVLSKEYPDGVDVIWETIGGSVYKMLFKHLADKGRLVIVGGITGYKTVGFPDVNISNLPTKLLIGSKSLTGFFAPSYQHLYQEYYTKLIGLYLEKKLKIVLDFGQNSKSGPFHGIETVENGVEHLLSGANVGKVVIKIQ